LSATESRRENATCCLIKREWQAHVQVDATVTPLNRMTYPTLHSE